MGIYYTVFNHTKKEFFDGDILNHGIKRWNTFNGTVAAVLTRLIESGSRWAGDKIEILADEGKDEVRCDKLEEKYTGLKPKDIREIIKDVLEDLEKVK